MIASHCAGLAVDPLRRASAAWLAVFAALCLGWPLSARGQLTPEMLIGGAVSDAGPYYEDLSDAIIRLRSGDVEGARALFIAARKKAPKLSPPEVMLANSLSALNQTAVARNELEKAILQYPQDPEPLVRLAEFDAAEGRGTEAELLFAKGIEVAEQFDESPKRKRLVQIRAYSTGAAVDEIREHWAQARDKLRSLVKLEPDSAIAHHRLAKALFKLGDMKAAFRELEASAAADPKLVMPAEITLAAFYNNANDRVNAEKWIAAAVKKGADSLTAQCGLANWYLESNSVEQALQHAEAALKIDPQSVEAKLARANVARMQKDWKTAETMLASVHLQAPTNSDAINHLALVLIEKPDEASHKRAAEFADLNVRLNPSNAMAAGTLGWIQYRLGKTADADRLFNLITVNNQQISNDLAYFVACLRKDQGRLAEAERLLEHVLSHENAFHYRKDAQDMLLRITKSPTRKPAPNKEPRATEKPKKSAEPKAARDSDQPAESK